MTTVALFNCTGAAPHVGCLAVTDAHDRMLAARGVRVLHRHGVGQLRDLWTGDRAGSLRAVAASPVAAHLAAADAVVVNGEGTIHHGAGLHLLSILEAALDMGKPALLVNAVLQDLPDHHDTLARLTDLTVRDAASASYLLAFGIPHRLVPDSILAAAFGDAPGTDLGGRVVLTDIHPALVAELAPALDALSAALGDSAAAYPLSHPARRTDWRSAVATFRTASVVVTGRHHGVYLAALAGVPFVALPSNSWKVEGTLALFGERPRVCRDPRTLTEAVRAAARERGLFADFGAFLRSHTPLTTFDRLPPSRVASAPSAHAVPAPYTLASAERERAGASAKGPCTSGPASNPSAPGPPLRAAGDAAPLTADAMILGHASPMKRKRGFADVI